MTTTPHSSTTSVVIPSTLPNNPSLTVSASGSLMKNYLPALPIAPGDQVTAACDSNGAPIVFSFGADSGDFYAIVNVNNDPTGWSQIDLLPGVAALGKPVYFASGQLSNGNLCLFLACQDATSGAVSTYVAGPLSNNLQQTNLAQLASLWTPAGNPLPGSSVNRASISPLDDGQGFGIPMLAVGLVDPRTTDVLTYMMQATVNTTTGAITWNWTAFPSPTDARTVLDYAPGAIADLGQGLYMLYARQDGSTQLIFKTLLNEFGRDYVRVLTVPAGQNSLQTTAGSGTTSFLYAGGAAGLVFWDASAQLDSKATGWTAAQTVASGSQLPGMSAGGLVVRQNFNKPNAIAAWALSGSNLYLLSQFEYQGALHWTTPLVLKTDIALIAPLINPVTRANELVFLTTDWASQKAIHYLWQDPATTLWQEETIPLYNSDKVQEVSSYSTKLSFRLNGQAPAARLPLTLTSASYQSLLVNGLKYTVNAGASVQVATNVTGELDIIQQIQDLAVSTFTLSSSAFTDTLQLNPASNVYKKLAAVRTGADIPVLPPTLPQGVTADQIASAIAQMMAFTPEQPYPTEVLSVVGTTPQAKAVARTARPPQVFALSFGPRGMRYHTGAEATQFGVVGTVGEWIVDAVGDVVQFIGNVVGQIGHMLFEVAETVIKITLNVAGRVIKFVIQNFPQLFAFLTALFKALMVGLDKLIGWLGELFGWDDIWATHRVIAKTLTGALDSLAKEAQQDSARLKKKMASIIAGPLGFARENFASMTVPASVASMVPSQAAAATQQSQPSINLDTPIASWASYQTQYSGMLLGGGPAGDLPAPVQKFIDDVLIPTCFVLVKAIEEDWKNLQAVFTGEGTTVENIVTFLQGLAKTIIDTLEIVLLGCVDYLLDLVPWVVQLLTEPVNMPFISGFYTWLTSALGQGDNAAEELTGVNLMSLLVAIPYTYLYKIANDGEAPFPSSGSNTKSKKREVEPLDLWTSMMRLDTAQSSSRKEASTAAKRYSVIGAGIASVSALLASLMGFVRAGLEEAAQKGKSGKCLLVAILAMGGIAASFTYPVETPAMDGTAHDLRIAVWVASILRMACTALPIPSVAVRGTIKACFDAGIGVAAISSDIIGSPSNSTWCSDVCSNLGGVITGISTAIVEVQPEAAVTMIAGMGLSYLGGNLVALVTALSMNISKAEAIYFQNVGG
ncbi:M24 family metallopeptidase [Myxococcus sp. AM001]|nr:M24 family metallopeptidase [Myxococcus sp. AM001]